MSELTGWENQNKATLKNTKKEVAQVQPLQSQGFLSNTAPTPINITSHVRNKAIVKSISPTTKRGY